MSPFSWVPRPIFNLDSKEFPPTTLVVFYNELGCLGPILNLCNPICGGGELIPNPGEVIGGFVVKFGPGLLPIGVMMGGFMLREGATGGGVSVGGLVLILKLFPPPPIGDTIGGRIVKLSIEEEEREGEGEREGAGEAAIRPKPLELPEPPKPLLPLSICLLFSFANIFNTNPTGQHLPHSINRQFSRLLFHMSLCNISPTEDSCSLRRSH